MLHKSTQVYFSILVMQWIPLYNNLHFLQLQRFIEKNCRLGHIRQLINVRRRRTSVCVQNINNKMKEDLPENIYFSFVICTCSQNYIEVQFVVSDKLSVLNAATMFRVPKIYIFATYDSHVLLMLCLSFENHMSIICISNHVSIIFGRSYYENEAIYIRFIYGKFLHMRIKC